MTFPVLPTNDYKSIFDTLDVNESTRKEYMARIKPFIIFFSIEGLHLDTFLKYKRMLAENSDYKVSTKNKYLACARVFLKECYRRGFIDRDITTNVKCFRQDKKHKVIGLTDDDVDRICWWIREHPEKNRENALLCLLILQGLRQSEICRIMYEDCDFKTQTLLIQGKGKDDKEMIYLHPIATRYLRRYCRQSNILSGYVFRSKRRQSRADRLTTRGLQLIVQRLLKELGIESTVHGFRHYYTSKLIRQMPGNLTVVAKFTRHKSLEMLQVYNDNLLMEHDLISYRKAFSGLKI